MDINTLRICITVISFLVFMGIMVYAVHPANRKRFERAAQLPFEEEGTLIPAVAINKEGAKALCPTLSQRERRQTRDAVSRKGTP